LFLLFKEELEIRKEVRMRQYETVFLISPSLSEEDTESLIHQMEDVVSKKKGKMVNKEEWGKRKLAYPIKKFEEAFYILFHYEGNPDLPVELERRFKQTETIIRYLTVRKETRENVRVKKRGKPAVEEVLPEEKMETTEPEEEEKTESAEEEK